MVKSILIKRRKRVKNLIKKELILRDFLDRTLKKMLLSDADLRVLLTCFSFHLFLRAENLDNITDKEQEILLERFLELKL